MNDSTHDSAHDPEIDDPDRDARELDDPIAAELQGHFRRRTRSVHAAHDAPHAVAVRRAATERIASRHHRRVAGASMTGAAAVAVVVALIVNAQAPQQVDTTDLAGPSSAAGVATGYSTGSATGSAKGWSTIRGDLAPAPGYLPLALTLPDTGAEALSQGYATTIAQDDGRPAPEIAVLADLRAGQPVRFVVASPQDAEHLSMGTGGTELTIAGRSARMIVDNHGWHKAIVALDEDTNVYVQAHGIDRGELEQAVSTLTVDGEGGWSMDGGTSGMTAVATTPPTEQSELNLEWATAPDSSSEIRTTLKQTGAGAYEFWASLVGYDFSYTGDLRALEVDLGDGTTTTAVLWSSPGSPSGSWAQLTALDPSGTVLKVSRSRWASEGAAPGTIVPSAGDELAAAAPTLFERLDEVAWQDLLERAVTATDRISQERAEEAEQSRGAPDPSGRPAGDPDPEAPAAVDPPGSNTTLAPSTSTTTTVIGPS